MKTPIPFSGRARFSTALVSAILLTVVFASGVTSGLEPQDVLTDAALYENARHAAAGRDYVNAMASIYAYLQRDTDYLLKDVNARDQIWGVYRSYVIRIDELLHPPAGVRSEQSVPPSLPERAPGPSGPSNPPVRARAVAPPSVPNAAPAGAGYALLCRGGGNLYFSYEPYSGVVNAPQILIRFERGASAGSLAPGQCVWPDRSIAPNEPSVLVFAAPVFTAQQFSIAWQRGQVMGISSELTFLNALLRDDGVKTFRVYNNGQGSFIVSVIE